MTSALSSWVQILVEGLVAGGVQSAVVSPGSRSTPLVLAASQSLGLKCFSIVDERGAAFFALGQAKVTGRPSALICTSGSAAANYYPAVIEAQSSRLPLVVVSADRPAELQYCGAPQTLDQVKLFGGFARYYQLGPPNSERDAQLALRRTVKAGVLHTLTRNRSPVHFNFPVGKPLEIAPPFREPKLPDFQNGLGAEPPGDCLRPSNKVVECVATQLLSSSRPLLIVGALGPGKEALRQAVVRYLATTDSLLCAEAVGQFRADCSEDTLAQSLDGFDWLLSCERLDALLTPDFILQIGSTPMSAGLQRLLRRCRETVPFVVCSEGSDTDPIHRSAQILPCDATPLLGLVSEQLESHRPPARQWGQWHRLNKLVWECVAETLQQDFSECSAVATLVKELPPNSFLSVGNSLAPRHLDRYVRATSRGFRVGSQRGASGIEGPIASALGAASVSSSPVTLLVGDVSFLHDIGSLWATSANRLGAPTPPHPVVLVVLNNGGGRIFEQLPIARQSSAPLHLWTTPHAIHIGELASAYGVAHRAVTDTRGLQLALKQAYSKPGVSIVEIQVADNSSMETAALVRAGLNARLEPLDSELPPLLPQ